MSNTLKLRPKTGGTVTVTPGQKRAAANMGTVQSNGVVYDIRGRLVSRSPSDIVRSRALNSSSVYSVKTSGGTQHTTCTLVLQP